MLAIINLILGIAIAVIVSIPETFSDTVSNYLDPATSRIHTMDSVEAKAFQILDRKCNVCHSKRNKKRVFTQFNMKTWSNDVYEQVFIKKRMPKGNKVRLAADEYSVLFAWIKTNKVQ